MQILSEYRRAEGKIKFLERRNDFIFPVEIWLYNDADNRNNWRFVNLEQHRPMWAGKPILIAYVNNGKQIGDGHNQRTGVDPKTGEPYASFTDATAERIVGSLSDNANDIRLVQDGEKVWVVARGFLWAWYAREIVAKITRDAEQGRDMSVSIEALVSQAYMDGEIEVETEYQPLGVTILGDKVQPAVDGAHIAMLAEMEEEFRELKMRAASYIEESEPKNETKKGLNTNMRLSKQQLRELQAKFGDSYTVHAAEQADNGVLVCLMDKAGKTYVYTMAALGEGVIPERIQEVNAQVQFCAEGFDPISVDACDIVERALSEIKELTERATAAENKLAESENTVNAMRDAENKRRVSAAKAAAKNKLADFNACREDKVSEKVLDSINEDIEGGVYTACVDKDGNWIGDKAVEEKVLSACAAMVMELDKKMAQQNKTKFVWERAASGDMDDGSIDALLARKGIR